MLAPLTYRTLYVTDVPPSGAMYPERVQFLLIRYARADPQAYVYDQVSPYWQASNINETEYRQKLWKLTHRLHGIVSENQIGIDYVQVSSP